MGRQYIQQGLSASTSSEWRQRKDGLAIVHVCYREPVLKGFLGTLPGSPFFGKCENHLEFSSTGSREWIIITGFDSNTINRWSVMPSLKQALSQLVSSAFADLSLDPAFGKVEVSKRADLADFQCNGAMLAAKTQGKAPRDIAGEVAAKLDALRSFFTDVHVAGPGFINLRITDEFLVDQISRMAQAPQWGVGSLLTDKTIVVDYGGANIAKPLHVGHLRAAIIGEALKRLTRYLGATVIGDVHLGDWGLQMGMVISELQARQPDLVYFDPAYTGPYPIDPPLTVDDLDEIYPTASKKCKDSPEALMQAQLATADLQRGRPGYRALWQHIRTISIADLERDYRALGVEFDVWYGESSVQAQLPGLVERLTEQGFVSDSEGARIIDLSDQADLPPLILRSSHDTELYGTTDLATIAQRVNEYHPDVILYVVDNRQSQHFKQVFSAACKTHIAPDALLLEHIGFGTMKGQDGRPFKTRAGGVMKLKDLIAAVTQRASERVREAGMGQDLSESDMDLAAHRIGIATLKFADLINHYATDYVFDLDRFSAFEGRTGPYLLYGLVRILSILRKAQDRGLQEGAMLPPASPIERDLLLTLAQLPDVLIAAYETRALNQVAEFAYGLATLTNKFYQEHHILNETDPARQRSWLKVLSVVASQIETCLNILGIEPVDRM